MAASEGSRPLAGGPADVARVLAVVPWLCVTVFRRLCSEQLCQLTDPMIPGRGKSNSDRRVRDVVAITKNA
jgi:hypothetical protein